MTDHTPVTGPELQEMKQRVARLRKSGVLVPGQIPDHVWDDLFEQMKPWYELLVEHTLCISEIERLRAALQRIYDDGVPYAWPIAAEALGITPPPIP